MADPTGFAVRKKGLALVPDPLWYLLGAIVSFYFGARELQKFREIRFTSPEAVQTVVRDIGMLRELRRDSLGLAAGAADLEAGSGDNKALTDWRARDGPA